MFLICNWFNENVQKEDFLELQNNTKTAKLYNGSKNYFISLKMMKSIEVKSK